jgi:PAS domain S-box-containing protein
MERASFFTIGDWKTIFKTIPHPTAILDAGQNILAINAVLEKHLGKKSADLKGVKCWEIFHGPGVKGPPHGCPFVDMVSSNCADVREIAVEAFNGTYLVSCTPLFDENGRLDKVVHLATDITEQVKIEAALQKRDILFKKLSDHVPGMIYQFKRKPGGVYSVPFTTEGIRDVFGCSPEDVRNDFSPIAKVILPEDLQKVADSIEYSAEHLTYWQCEYRVMLPGRPIRWMMGQSTPEKQADGSVIWHGFNTDITDRKLAEEKTQALLDSVQREKNRLSALLESIPDEVWFADSEGIFTIANPAALEEFCLSPGETIEVRELAKSLEVLRPDGSCRPVEEAPPLRALSGEVVKNLEEIVRTPANGELRYRQVSSTPVRDHSGAIMGSVSVVRDITDQKKLEELREKLEVQLRQSQKIEALGRLAGGIAHEFNNILTGISGNISLALMDLSNNDPVRPGLEQAAVAVERAAKLTSHLLALSRKQILEPKVIDFNDLLRGLQGRLSRMMRDNIRVVMRLGENLEAVRIDPGQLEQVVKNIAVNSRDAMPQGGTLTIETVCVELGEDYCRLHPYTPPGRYLMLAISDTGTGMDASVIQNLFDPFFTTKGIANNSGLGLPIAYGIVKQHSGSIEVYSEGGHGTTFKIYLPMVDGKTEKPAGAPFSK